MGSIFREDNIYKCNLVVMCITHYVIEFHWVDVADNNFD